ncbi:MAG TPA: hypothetical protein VF765_13210 [Polyangiaceae bacterium]
MQRGLLAAVTLGVAVALGAGACTTPQPQHTTFFDTTIDPILQGSCVRSNTGVGCHVSDAKGNAFGNLDLSTYDGVDKRRDLLLDYGPYLQPSLLVKNVPPYELTVQLWDGTKVPVTTDIKHVGGPILDPTASAYYVLRRWIENGATADNTGVPPVNITRAPCSHTIPGPGVAPPVAGTQPFNPNADPKTNDWGTFLNKAEPVFESNCVAGNCHGTAVNALYLTCGSTPQEERWNYYAASRYLATTPEQSEIVRRPLATSQGGSYHEGGPLFSSVNDSGYQALKAWATDWVKYAGPPKTATLDPAFVFFAQMVQPVLVKKGCMMAQCHSAGMFHDYRLRGGSAGSFSLNTTLRNYAFTVEQMSFESDDVGASRLVRKNLYRPDVFTGSNGIAHRGGALFEDFGMQLPSAKLCAMGNYTYTPANIDAIPAYCVIAQWHQMERMERNLAAPTEIVYVSRPIPPAPDTPQDFDTFVGGASLHIAAITFAPGSPPTVTLGADKAVDLTTCGLGSSPDVRRPAVSWDAQTIAFAARASATDPLAIYTMNPDGTGCAKQSDISNHAASGNSLLEHDFDPAFSPPGPEGKSRIVFASTRGNLDSSAFDYSGPQRMPEDPSKSNANLYVWDPSIGASNHVRQLTWQLNMERFPSFMQDGRLVFTAEKREPGFLELALRRQNLDGGDYHPLYSQRATIGYEQSTNVVELSYKDFAAVMSHPGAQHGAGSLIVFNRSIGVDFTSNNPKDYLVDPSCINPASASSVESNFFLHSLRVVGTDGSYTSPSPLPDGEMLVAFGAGQPASFGGDYDLYVMDPVSGNKTKLVGTAGTQETEAVAVYPRVNKGIFVSTPDEPNGHTYITPGAPNADVTVLDMGLLASLLFQNTPTGRVVENDLSSFEVWEDMPPELSVTSMPSQCSGNVACDSYGKVYVRRRELGSGVPVESDGSARFAIPGGLPIVLHLGDTSESKAMKLPRWQREEMTFLPGETAHQGMPSFFFDHVCSGCHNAVSGKPIDAALNPDFLTQASQVAAASSRAVDLTGPPSKRGSIQGPPSTP